MFWRRLKRIPIVFGGGPFIRYWNIKKSEIGTRTHFGTPIGFTWQPKNNSTEVGIKLAIKCWQGVNKRKGVSDVIVSLPQYERSLCNGSAGHDIHLTFSYGVWDFK
jgi:hypothetical protein